MKSIIWGINEMWKVFGIILLFWLLITLGGTISIPMFKYIVGGGIEQEFLYPIYFGIIALAGLIVGCTIILYEKLKKIENKLNDSCK